MRSVNLVFIFIVGLLLFFCTGYFNVGFIALDGYSDIITKIIPSQNITASSIIESSGIRSPLPSLALYGVSRSLLEQGVMAPLAQLRWVLGLWALLAYVIIALSTIGILWKNDPFDDQKPARSGLVLVTFFFLAPLFFTRPMIESLSTPFLVASCFFAVGYDRHERWTYLVMSMLLLTISSIFRFQVGVCALALLLIPLIKLRYVHFLGLVGVAGVLFFATGWMDELLRGSFHASLKNYMAYNVAHSSSYGVSPFYTYLLLFLGLSIPPTFFMRFEGLFWRKTYRPLLPVLLYFLVFLLAHSLVPHKEERFMIPALPLFLILLVPLWNFLTSSPGYRWRVRYFQVLNGVLLVLVVINVPQNNIIGLASYMEKRPEIESLMSFDNSLILFPQAFVTRPIPIKNTSKEALLAGTEVSCSSAVAVRRDKLDSFEQELKDYYPIAQFKPGVLEHLIVLANPSKNGRRGSITLFQQAQCLGR